MKLNLYDTALNRIAIIDGHFVSCLWQEKYNEKGSFTLELQATEEYKQKVRRDCYVGRTDRKTLMIIKSVVIEKGLIKATGFTADRTLEDVAFIGTITAGTKVIDGVKSAYNGSNQYPNIVIADSDIIDKYGHQISNKSMYVLLETMCKETDIGFRAVKSGNLINIELYKPVENPNIRFSKAFGNLKDEKLTLSNQQYKNYAVVLGQGEAENRVRVDVDLSNGSTHKEMILDAKDVQQKDGESTADYQSRLYARGVEKLLEQVETFNASFTPMAADFGVRYDLGDIASVYLPEYKISIKARITAFQQKEQNNKTATTVSVGSLTIIKR